MRPGMESKLVRSAALAVLACATTALASGGVPDARLGIRTAPILLLSRADVRAELRLTPEQAEEADRIIADLRDRALALRGRSDAEAVAARDEIDRASRAWLARKLDADQNRRLVQVDLQWEGPSALLSRPFVAESLGLTSEQRAAIAPLIVAHKARRNGGPPVPADEARLRESTLALLDDAQRTRWRAMLGAGLPFARVAARESPAPASRR